MYVGNQRHALLESETRAAMKHNLLMQATEMLRNSKGKFPPKIGDTVRIQVPDIVVFVQMHEMCWRLLLE